MADKTRWLSNYETATSEYGREYTLNLFVNASDFDTYMPSFGSSCDWTPETAYVYRATSRGAGDHYLITITARSADWDEGYSYRYRSKPDPVRSMGKKEFFMRPEFWGVHQASNSDNGYYNIESKKVGEDSLNTNWVYNNASKKNSDVGSPVYDTSPFTSLPSPIEDDSINDDFIKLVGKTFPIREFSVTFYSDHSFSYYNAFHGVNPGTTGSFQPPANADPDYNDTVAGKWLATFNKSADKIEYEGTEYTKVTRKCIHVPEIDGIDLYWDSDKFGTWDWYGSDS